MTHSQLLSTADGGPASPSPANFWQLLSLGARHQASRLALVSRHQPPGHLSNLFAPSKSSPGSSSADVGFRCSYEQLVTAVENLATILYEKGVRESDVVASFIGNNYAVEWTLLLLTCWRIGAVFAPVEPSLLARTKELNEVYKLLKPKVVVLGDGIDTKSWVVNDVGEKNAVIWLICGGNAGACSERWSSLSHLTYPANSSSSPPPSVSPPTNPALIMFTSGTTSTPKGCCLTFANIHAEIEGHHAFAYSSWSQAARFLVTTSLFRPLCYLGCLSSWIAGGSVIFTSPFFDPAASIEGLKAERGTHLMILPTQLRALVTEFVQQNHSLEHEILFISPAGDVSDKELIRSARQALKPRRFVPHWGASEGSPMFGFSVADNTLASLPMLESGDTGIGRALPGTKAKICSAKESSRTPVPRGVRGELHVSSPVLIHSYLGNVSSSSFYEDAQGRWFRTGDWAVMDDDGVVYVVGRIKDTIKCRGIGLFPPVIEGYIKDSFGVQATVIGVPDVDYGEMPVAVLKSLPSTTTDKGHSHLTKTELSSSNHFPSNASESAAQAIIHGVLAHLGSEYILGAVYTLAQLELADWPLNSSAKLDKKVLRGAVERKCKQDAVLRVSY
ncbi:hypothetical protein TCE0_038f12545 [Talaromyces pinophilus]|uniref:AMP-dependent synthetase/ligase domain-containing protein n=1 Tax=Talaromyces pinophilus TaxID=128442 RepID=A0A0B8MYH7_TALPI|nr:hypothetical protein TCE0_038f12545 [Talaromyces pinophilus]